MVIVWHGLCGMGSYVSRHWTYVRAHAACMLTVSSPTDFYPMVLFFLCSNLEFFQDFPPTTLNPGAHSAPRACLRELVDFVNPKNCILTDLDAMRSSVLNIWSIKVSLSYIHPRLHGLTTAITPVAMPSNHFRYAEAIKVADLNHSFNL